MIYTGSFVTHHLDDAIVDAVAIVRALDENMGEVCMAHTKAKFLLLESIVSWKRIWKVEYRLHTHA